jgi:hypothetical protein
VPVGKGGLKAVLRGAGQVHHARVAPALVGGPGAARDHVAVRVNGIDRIHQRHHTIPGEDLLEIGAVALAAVADEDLVDPDLHAARGEIVAGDLRAQKLVADVRTVATERLGVGHLVGGVVDRVDHGRRQRAGHVADAEVDQADVWVGVAEDLRAPTDLGEEVAGLEVAEVLVDLGHRVFSLPNGGRPSWSGAPSLLTTSGEFYQSRLARNRGAHDGGCPDHHRTADRPGAATAVPVAAESCARRSTPLESVSTIRRTSVGQHDGLRRASDTMSWRPATASRRGKERTR